MKSMNDENGGNTNVNKWLGFSLSPHMTMKANAASDPHHLSHHSEATHPTSASFYISSPQLTNSAACYGVGENGDFHSPFSVMPLKSDGSLCIVEALSRSHTEGVVPNSSPKLEDFLGGATVATHQYGMHPRDAMVLSLDSTLYNNEPFRQHQYYSELNCNGIYQTTKGEQPDEQSQLLGCTTEIPPMSEDEIPCLKTWIDPHHALEQQVNNTNTSMVEGRGAVGCGDLQSLSLSMSPGSQSSCVTASRQISPIDTNDCVVMETKKRGSEKLGLHKQTVHRKSIDTFGQRTSQYRGVTRHRWTGRYEAHLWDNSCKKEGQTRKGRQVYLGGYDMEEKAARAYDLAALKYWGPSTHINFGLENYHQELGEMKNMTRQEYVAHLRRKSSGFSRGASIYRGVTRHHQHGRWQARIGRVAGNKDLYLGTFSTQEEAAEAYDIAAIKFRGVNAVTNFNISRYDVKKIMESDTLPTGEIARRNKEEMPNAEPTINYNTSAAQRSQMCTQVENIANESDWKAIHNQANPGNQENVAVESLDVKAMNVGHYHNPTFSVPLHDLIGNDSSQAVVDESTNVAQHFSNASSLATTSLNSSREASPEKYGATIQFAKANALPPKFINPSSNVNTWTSTAQLRSVPLTTTHLPIFAAWNGT